jgi:hypothetical protein
MSDRASILSRRKIYIASKATGAQSSAASASVGGAGVGPIPTLTSTATQAAPRKQPAESSSSPKVLAGSSRNAADTSGAAAAPPGSSVVLVGEVDPASCLGRVAREDGFDHDPLQGCLPGVVERMSHPPELLRVLGDDPRSAVAALPSASHIIGRNPDVTADTRVSHISGGNQPVLEPIYSAAPALPPARRNAPTPNSARPASPKQQERQRRRPGGRLPTPYVLLITDKNVALISAKENKAIFCEPLFFLEPNSTPLPKRRGSSSSSDGDDNNGGVGGAQPLAAAATHPAELTTSPTHLSEMSHSLASGVAASGAVLSHVGGAMLTVCVMALRRVDAEGGT